MADIEKTKATEAEKTEYAEPDMRPEKLIKQQEREAKMTPDELYAELKARLDKAFTAEEAAEIDKAFRVAREAHKAQLRYSGQPYIIHPIAVSNILLDLGMDAQSVEAALLHDTVEDTDITLDYIKHEFGDDVAALVDGGRCHQTGTDPLLLPRGAAGGKYQKNAACHVPRHKGHHNQAC